MSLTIQGPEAVLRARRLPPRLRLAIGVEVVATYAVVRLLLLGREIGPAVARLRAGAHDRHSDQDAHRIGRRLASPVRRTLAPLPWDSRCLMRSLVLLRMCARRGVVTTLVIGVRPGDDFEAHAWIEHAHRPLLPTLRYEPLTRI